MGLNQERAKNHSKGRVCVKLNQDVAKRVGYKSGGWSTGGQRERGERFYGGERRKAQVRVSWGQVMYYGVNHDSLISSII